jgi:ferritin-like metal-binding protein YciE
MALSNYEDVLYHALKDLLSAEKQFRDALPKLANAANDPDLASAFEEHRAETQTHVERIERAFELLGRAQRSEKCEAAEGLVEEGEDLIDEEGDPPYKDIALAGGGRKVEHYEIVTYMDAIEHAEALGHDELAALLGETLAEEQAADEKLHALAKRLSATALRTA